MKTKISIIIPSYNKEKFIAMTIDSVLNQTYKNWELLIVDDCSTDSTQEIIQSKLIDTRLKYFPNETNKGANYCRNIGIEFASGDFLVFLDADDVLLATCLESRLKSINSNLDKNLYVFSMGVFKEVIGDDKRVWIPNTKYPLKDFLSHNLPWQTMQAVWKIEYIKELGGFDVDFQRLQDVELHTRALLSKNIDLMSICSKPDCYFRIDDDRKNFNSFSFINRWVNSAVLYYEKFFKLVPKSNRSYLIGTLYQTNNQIIRQFRSGNITKKEFVNLNKTLFGYKVLSGIPFTKRILIQIGNLYNLYFIRIPGINRLIFKILIY